MVTAERIQQFFDGYGNEKYIVNIETSRYDNIAVCIIHDPEAQKKKIKKIQYTPFLYLKDLKKLNLKLFNGNETFIRNAMKNYGITIKKVETGGHERLENGYKYLLTSSKSYKAILDFLKDGGIDIYKNDKISYSVSTDEQFFITTGNRLFKGIDEYNKIHKLTFDIETKGLDPKKQRLFQIGVKDNYGFETVVEVKRENDDESEREVITEFFNIVNRLKPAIICGYNSEEFDVPYILERAEQTNLDINLLPTTLDEELSHDGMSYNRKLYKTTASVKFGNEAKKYEKTVSWGYSYIDILHAAKRAQAINSDIENTKLKYICKFNKINKPNRMYVEGNKIYKIWSENKNFIINTFDSTYSQIPEKYENRVDDYLKMVEQKYHKKIVEKTANFKIISGKDIVRRYLLDDLWETEKVDNLYNETSFQLAKMVPTVYSRVTTMGTAAVWNLLMTAWSFENNIAIPYTFAQGSYPGGLTRVFKIGFNKLIEKIDFSGLYPSIQLNGDVFPDFDITNVMKSMLTHTVTQRNVFKKLAKSDNITDKEKKFYESKQLPLKILNNSLYGALGSGIAFQWADVSCAARITCSGRIYLRQLVAWMRRFITPLLAVTDGVNFSLPEMSDVDINGNKLPALLPIDEAWKYNNKTGYDALIEKYNNEVLDKRYMKVDADDRWASCLNLSRINYANLTYKDKNGVNKIKLTGNTIKSKVMAEYIDTFIKTGMKQILENEPGKFIEYYYTYLSSIFYKNIPLKKICSKSKIKTTIPEYIRRGVNKAGVLKGKAAYMEILIRENLTDEQFKEYVDIILSYENKNKSNNTLKNKVKNNLKKLVKKLFDENKPIEEIREAVIKSISESEWVENRLPDLVGSINTYSTIDHFLTLQNHITSFYVKRGVEFITEYDQRINSLFSGITFLYDQDSLVYYYNVGVGEKHSDTQFIRNETGDYALSVKRISEIDLEKNPDLTGDFNVSKYITSFNNRVEKILVGFSEEVQSNLLVNNPKDRMVYTENEMMLLSYDKDEYDEFLTLEDKEEDFWNKYGYNPFKIFDGFKYNNLSGYHEYSAIYENLKGIFESKNRPFKRIDDLKDENDFFLYKNDDKYEIRYIKDGYHHHYKDIDKGKFLNI